MDEAKAPYEEKANADRERYAKEKKAYDKEHKGGAVAPPAPPSTPKPRKGSKGRSLLATPKSGGASSKKGKGGGKKGGKGKGSWEDEDSMEVEESWNGDPDDEEEEEDLSELDESPSPIVPATPGTPRPPLVNARKIKEFLLMIYRGH